MGSPAVTSRPGNAQSIFAQPIESQRSAFFRGWTRKEAFLKARGDGLWLGLDQFEVSIDPAEPPRLVRTLWDPSEAARWSLMDLEIAPGYAAALSIAGTDAPPGPIEVAWLSPDA